MGSRKRQPGIPGLVSTRTAATPEIVEPKTVRIRSAAHRVNGQNGGPEKTAMLAALRRKWVPALLLGLLIGGGGAAAVWFFYEPPFVAFTEVRVYEVADRLLFDTQQDAGFATYKQTQMRLVKSPVVLSAALRNPEIARLPMVRELEHPVHWLEEHLQVTSPASEFVRISLEGDRPKDLAALVNAIREAYLKDFVEAEQQRKRERKRDLERVQSDIENELRLEQQEMQALAEALHTSDSETLSVKQQMAAEYFGQLRREHARIRFELMNLRVELAAQDGPDGSAEADERLVAARLERTSEIQQLDAELYGLKRLLRTRSERVAAGHPALADLERRIAQATEERDRLEEELRPELLEEVQQQTAAGRKAELAEMQKRATILAAQEKEIREELGTEELETQQMGYSSYQLELQKKRVTQIEQVAERVKEKLQQFEVELEAPPRVQSYLPAVVPHTPEIGTRNKLAALAGLGGFACIAGLLIWTDYLARKVSSADEVSRTLGMPILGTLPVMPRWMLDGRNKHLGARPALMRGLWKESIDSTRAMLLGGTEPGSPRVILVSSAVAGEGKTTLACHLAASLAQSGRKTLLIDADLRRPTAHVAFGLSRDVGFSEALRGEVSLTEATRCVRDDLYVLTAGQADQQTHRMLSGNAAEQAFFVLREQFDFIIIDSAPVIAVADALVIGSHADGVLFSVRRDVSRLDKLAAASERFAMLGIPVLGAVVTGMEQSAYRDRYAYSYAAPADNGRKAQTN